MHNLEAFFQNYELLAVTIEIQREIKMFTFIRYVIKLYSFSRFSVSHGGRYEDNCLLGSSTV